MGNQVLILVTVALIAVSAVGLAYSVRRLRRETTLNPRTWLLGAGVPAVATLAYLLLGGPPFHPLVVVVAFAVGLAATALVGMARADNQVVGVARQSGVTLATWSVVYVIAALSALAPLADTQALLAVLLALTAGLATGTQVGKAVGGQGATVRGVAVAPQLVTAGGPPVAWSQPIDRPPAPAPLAAQTEPTPHPIAPTPPEAPAEPELVAVAPGPELTAGPPATPPVPALPPVPADPPARPAPAPVAPVAPPAPPVQAAPPEQIHFTHSGRRFYLGYTASYFGIWDVANTQGAQVQYPRSPEGRVAAWSQFSMWEPGATPVLPYPGLPMAPIADGPVMFSHVGARFALGHTSALHAIWDRWAPGAPVASFGLDTNEQIRAWQTFLAWEPAAVQL